MDLTDHAETQLANFIRGTQLTPPANWFVALLTQAGDEDGTLVEVDTGVWTNYARAQIAASAGAWNAPADEAGGGKLVDNAGDLSFGTAAITGTPPVVTHFAVCDAQAAGNVWFTAALAAGKTINDGDPVTIPAGDLDLIFR